MHHNFNLADSKIEDDTELIIMSQEYEPNKKSKYMFIPVAQSYIVR